LGYGRLLRIGVLVPSSNTTIEKDFHSMAPEGVTVNSTRMMLTELTSEAILRMADEAQKGIELLKSANVDVIVYGCPTCSLIGGVDWENVLFEQIKFETGLRVIITSQAVVEALRALGGGKIGVATPYEKKLNNLEKRYLEGFGLEVSKIKGLGKRDYLDIGSTNSSTIQNLVDRVARNVDIIYIGCTNLPVIHLIDKFEKKYGVPVVTSNQASFWAAINGSGVKSIDGYGALLQNARARKS